MSALKITVTGMVDCSKHVLQVVIETHWKTPVFLLYQTQTVTFSGQEMACDHKETWFGSVPTFLKLKNIISYVSDREHPRSYT